jgi:hypothetical protein
VQALENANELIERNLELVSAGRESVLQEEFGEHYAQLIERVNRLRKADATTPRIRQRALRAMVLGSYLPGGEFSRELAQEGDELVPYVLEAVKSTSGPKRWNGYALIADIWQASEAGGLRNPLSPTSRQDFQAVARHGLQDPAPDVRVHAVRAVVAGKDKAALPLLIRMSEQDADAIGPMSVRAEAAKAAQKLRDVR